MSRKWKNWYQYEVDEEIKGADSRDMVKHTKRSRCTKIKCSFAKLNFDRLT